MKRKVIKLANKTLVISLPHTWAKQWNIIKGQEIDITENGPRLTISTNQQRENNKNNTNLEDANERTIKWTLSALHKKGYDDIELTYKTPEQAQTIQNTIRDLFIGATIIHQTNDNCIIRNVTTEKNDTYDTMLRRAFLITLNLAEETHKATQQETSAEHILDLEKTNNQITNFCERLLNKYNHKQPENTTFHYVIIWNLEKIADNYKYICKQLPRTTTPETKQLFQKTNKILREYYELFYNYDIKKLSKLAEQTKELQQEIIKNIQENPKDTPITIHLHTITLQAADFSASIVAINS